MCERFDVVRRHRQRGCLCVDIEHHGERAELLDLASSRSAEHIGDKKQVDPISDHKRRHRWVEGNTDGSAAFPRDERRAHRTQVSLCDDVSCMQGTDEHIVGARDGLQRIGRHERRRPLFAAPFDRCCWVSSGDVVFDHHDLDGAPPSFLDRAGALTRRQNKPNDNNDDG